MNCKATLGISDGAGSGLGIPVHDADIANPVPQPGEIPSDDANPPSPDAGEFEYGIIFA